MVSPSLTIRKTFERHRAENPDSQVSEKAIRRAVRTGELPSIQAGNRALICWDTFEAWRRGDLSRE